MQKQLPSPREVPRSSPRKMEQAAGVVEKLVAGTNAMSAVSAIRSRGVQIAKRRLLTECHLLGVPISEHTLQQATAAQLHTYIDDAKSLKGACESLQFASVEDPTGKKPLVTGVPVEFYLQCVEWTDKTHGDHPAMFTVVKRPISLNSTDTLMRPFAISLARVELLIKVSRPGDLQPQVLFRLFGSNNTTEGADIHFGRVHLPPRFNLPPSFQFADKSSDSPPDITTDPELFELVDLVTREHGLSLPKGFRIENRLSGSPSRVERVLYDEKAGWYFLKDIHSISIIVDDSGVAESLLGSFVTFPPAGNEVFYWDVVSLSTLESILAHRKNGAGDGEAVNKDMGTKEKDGYFELLDWVLDWKCNIPTESGPRRCPTCAKAVEDLVFVSAVDSEVFTVEVGDGMMDRWRRGDRENGENNDAEVVCENSWRCGEDALRNYICLVVLFQKNGWIDVRVKPLCGGKSGAVVMMVNGKDAVSGESAVPQVVKAHIADDVAEEFEVHLDIIKTSKLAKFAPKKIELSTYEGRGAMSMELVGASLRLGDLSDNYEAETLRDLVLAEVQSTMGGEIAVTGQHVPMSASAAIRKLFNDILLPLALDQLTILPIGDGSLCPMKKILASIDRFVFCKGNKKKTEPWVIEMIKEKGPPGFFETMDECTKIIRGSYNWLTDSNVTSLFGYVHGDLNGRNAIIDSVPRIWIIDFGNTGLNGLLFDIAKVETSVLFEYICEDMDDVDVDSICALCRDIYGDNLNPRTLMPSSNRYEDQWRKNQRCQLAFHFVKKLRESAVRYLSDAEDIADKASLVAPPLVQFRFNWMPFLLKMLCFREYTEPQFLVTAHAVVSCTEGMKKDLEMFHHDLAGGDGIARKFQTLETYSRDLRLLYEKIRDPVSGEVTSILEDCVSVTVKSSADAPLASEGLPKATCGLLHDDKRDHAASGILVFGDAGNGKSVELKRTLLVASMHQPSVLSKGTQGGGKAVMSVYIPIANLVSLHRSVRGEVWRHSGCVDMSICELHGWSEDVAMLFHSIVHGAAGTRRTMQVALVLDGFDEVNEEAQGSICSWLIDLQETAQKRKSRLTIILATRRIGLARKNPIPVLPPELVLRLGSATYKVFDLEGLSEAGRYNLTAIKLRSPGEPERFIGEINNIPEVIAMSFSPLYLAMLSAVFRAGGALPQNRSRLYNLGMQLVLRRIAEKDIIGDADQGKAVDDDTVIMMIRVALGMLAFENHLVFQTRTFSVTRLDALCKGHLSHRTRDIVRRSPHERLLDGSLSFAAGLAENGQIPILQAAYHSSQRSDQSLVFSHWTLQEYFAAWMVAQSISSCRSSPADLAAIVDSVFQSSRNVGGDELVIPFGIIQYEWSVSFVERLAELLDHRSFWPFLQAVTSEANDEDRKDVPLTLVRGYFGEHKLKQLAEKFAGSTDLNSQFKVLCSAPYDVPPDMFIHVMHAVYVASGDLRSKERMAGMEALASSDEPSPDVYIDTMMALHHHSEYAKICSMASTVNSLAPTNDCYRRIAVLSQFHFAWAQGLKELGEWDASIEQYSICLEKRKNHLGDSNPVYATTLMGIAVVYRNKKETERALGLYREVMAIQERTIGTKHHDYGTTCGSMAGAYRNAGELHKALELMNRNIDIAKKTIGEHHPFYAGTLWGIAGVQSELGDHESAVKIFEEVVRLRRPMGADNAMFLGTLTSKAKAHMMLKQFDQAEGLYEEVRSTYLRLENSGKPPPPLHVADLYFAFGELRQQEGRMADAVDLFAECVRRRTKTLGPDHVDTQKAEAKLDSVRQ